MLGLTTTNKGHSLTDEEVLRRSINEPWLFAILLDRYETPFLRKAQSIIFNKSDAEEVVQDTFTKIYVNAASFSPQDGAKFSSWAYKILMNTAFTRYQKLLKEGQRFTSLDPEFEQFISEQKEHGALSEKKDGVERILSRLPGHFAQVLRLHYLERWSHADIAKHTKESVGTIKVRIYRAKIAFRRESREEEIEGLM
ncbi:MAG: RNA polymerase sigma factor [Candidatus Nomurabacteria bacterium]|nr:RNA polymerase sigma factor [Candidatus Nomurabacteria bacterium]USN88189.1 MAG: RNA polymerase sigma factor [Candidatus Nomurabacteria bacterium]